MREQIYTTKASHWLILLNIHGVYKIWNRFITRSKGAIFLIEYAYI